MKEEKKSKNEEAKKVAEVMVANMKANMEDPDFLLKKERRQQEAADKIIRMREEREKERKENK